MHGGCSELTSIKLKSFSKKKQVIYFCINMLSQPITSYPTLSDDTIALHDSGVCCGFIPIGKATVSQWQDIIDDGDDEVIITKQGEETQTGDDDIEIMFTRIIGSAKGEYTHVLKRSYNKNIKISLVFKNMCDDPYTGREFIKGYIVINCEKYNIVKYTRHYITERGYYISNCVYESATTNTRTTRRCNTSK